MIRLFEKEDGALYVSWTPVKGAERYKIQMSSEHSFDRIIAEYGADIITETWLGKLDNLEPCYVRVIALVNHKELSIGVSPVKN